VSGTLFPQPGAPGPARPFEAVVDAIGRWQSSVPIAAREAAGSYGVEARCSTGFAYATGGISFPVPDDAPQPVPVGPGSGTPVPGPAVPVPGSPSYTG
jgi:hypothetical protein